MTFDKPRPLADLAKIIQAELIGDAALAIVGANEVRRATRGEIVFADSDRYLDEAISSSASAVVVPPHVQAAPFVSAGKSVLRVEEPHRAFNALVKELFPAAEARPAAGIHATAVISTTATIADGCSVGPFCVISDDVLIGKDSVLEAHVTVERGCRIGDNCHVGSHTSIYTRCRIRSNVRIGSGSRIGTSAFYFFESRDELVRGTTLGSVDLGDGVDIGSQCTVDRGISGDTTIGDDSKLDSQVHIGHDVRIGRRVRIAALTGIGGYVLIGDRVTIRGQVGVTHGIKIAQGATILGKSGVDRDVAESEIVFGVPAVTKDRYAQRDRMLIKRIRTLERAAALATGSQPDLLSIVLQVVAEAADVEVTDIRLDQRLREDLGVDSLDQITLQIALQEELEELFVDIALDEQLIEKARTVGDVVDIARSVTKTSKRQASTPRGKNPP